MTFDPLPLAAELSIAHHHNQVILQKLHDIRGILGGIIERDDPGSATAAAVLAAQHVDSAMHVCHSHREHLNEMIRAVE